MRDRLNSNVRRGTTINSPPFQEAIVRVATGQEMGKTLANLSRSSTRQGIVSSQGIFIFSREVRKN